MKARSKDKKGGGNSMKRLLILSTFVTVLVLFLAGQPLFVCGKSAESGVTYTLVAQSGQTDGRTTGDEMKQTGGDEKESFRADMKKAVQDIDKDIATLSKKVEKEGSKAKAEAKESWRDLKAKQEVAKKKVKELSTAGKEAWDKVKSEAHDAVKEVKKAYEKAVSYFK
jgi:hypothetical protein